MLINFGGVDMSMVDYPGLPAAVVFLRGCPLNCPKCHNADLKKGSKQVSVQDIEDLIPWPFIEALVISGGEPLEQPMACFALIRMARRYSKKVAIQTSGNNPEAMRNLTPDAWYVDTKPGLDYTDAVFNKVNFTSCRENIREGLNYVRIYDRR